MTDPLSKFPLLFKSQWHARGLHAAIDELDVAALVAEYHGVREVCTSASIAR